MYPVMRWPEMPAKVFAIGWATPGQRLLAMRRAVGTISQLVQPSPGDGILISSAFLHGPNESISRLGGSD